MPTSPPPPLCCERPSELVADGGGSPLYWCPTCGSLWSNGERRMPEWAEFLTPAPPRTPEQEAVELEEWRINREVIREVRRRRLC